MREPSFFCNLSKLDLTKQVKCKRLGFQMSMRANASTLQLVLSSIQTASTHVVLGRPVSSLRDLADDQASRHVRYPNDEFSVSSDAEDGRSSAPHTDQYANWSPLFSPMASTCPFVVDMIGRREEEEDVATSWRLCVWGPTLNRASDGQLTPSSPF